MSQLPTQSNKRQLDFDAPVKKYNTDKQEQIKLSARDSVRMLNLLENPPEPNNKLMTAALALPKDNDDL